MMAAAIFTLGKYYPNSYIAEVAAFVTL